MALQLMKSVQQLLDHYGESHQHVVNERLHWVCVPAIMLSLLGLIWSLPVPQIFQEISPWLNWATLFWVVVMLYYLYLSLPLALGMLLVSLAMLFLVQLLAGLAVPLWRISLGIFVVAWIGQFIGHHLEGKRPSFFEDVRYLLIGPLWLLSFCYRRLGIAY